MPWLPPQAPDIVTRSPQVQYLPQRVRLSILGQPSRIYPLKLPIQERGPPSPSSNDCKTFLTHRATSPRKSVIPSRTKLGCTWPHSSRLGPLCLMLARAPRDVKFITVWFQNRRQSDKRKAWTKRDRAKKKENSCQQIDTIILKPAISLDQIASRLERVQRPARTDKPRSALSSKGPANLVEPKTPTSSKPKALWAHMPSSPPEALSSPPSETLQSLNAPRLVKSGKSLEWACANARMGSKHRHRKDRRIRAVQPQPTSPRRHSAIPEKEQESDEDQDQDVEVSAPSSSQGQDDRTSPRVVAPLKSPGELSGKSTEDVEAAMVLLQFLRG